MSRLHMLLCWQTFSKHGPQFRSNKHVNQKISFNVKCANFRLKCSALRLIRAVLSSGFLIAMLSVFLDATATASWCDRRHCRNVFVPCITVLVCVYTGPLCPTVKTFLAELDCWKLLQVSRLNWCILCAGRLRTRQLSGVRVWKKSWTTAVRVFVLLYWILPS